MRQEILENLVDERVELDREQKQNKALKEAVDVHRNEIS